MTKPTNPGMIPYEEFFSLCDKAFKRYGEIFDLPVADEPLDYLKKIYNREFRGGRVLDFGCGAKKPLQAALGIGDELYHSCDSDTSGAFTFCSVDDIPEGPVYDVVAANQSFEHLGYEEGIWTALKLAARVAPGGIMQVGVPNPLHPTRYLSDPTHKTPWNYKSICALMELGGLDPFLCARSNKKSAHVPRWHERWLVGMITRIYRMDWCDTVYIVGKKPGPEAVR